MCWSLKKIVKTQKMGVKNINPGASLLGFKSQVGFTSLSLICRNGADSELVKSKMPSTRTCRFFHVLQRKAVPVKLAPVHECKTHSDFKDARYNVRKCPLKSVKHQESTHLLGS